MDETNVYELVREALDILTNPTLMPHRAKDEAVRLLKKVLKKRVEEYDEETSSLFSENESENDTGKYSPLPSECEVEIEEYVCAVCKRYVGEGPYDLRFSICRECGLIVCTDDLSTGEAPICLPCSKEKLDRELDEYQGHPPGCECYKYRVPADPVTELEQDESDPFTPPSGVIRVEELGSAEAETKNQHENEETETTIQMPPVVGKTTDAVSYSTGTEPEEYKPTVFDHIATHVNGSSKPNGGLHCDHTDKGKSTVIRNDDIMGGCGSGWDSMCRKCGKVWYE